MSVPARFRRIIHQQAQVSSFDTFYSNLDILTIVLLSDIFDNSRHLHGIHQTVLKNALAIRPCNYEVASEPLLSKVAGCIPVLSSHYIGKCAAPVLKRSTYMHRKIEQHSNI